MSESLSGAKKNGVAKKANIDRMVIPSSLPTPKNVKALPLPLPLPVSVPIITARVRDGDDGDDMDAAIAAMGGKGGEVLSGSEGDSGKCTSNVNT